MASFFDENFKLTARGIDLYREIHSMLSPLYQELLEEGYSPREITAILINAASTTEQALVQEWEIVQTTNKRTR